MPTVHHCKPKHEKQRHVQSSSSSCSSSSEDEEELLRLQEKKLRKYQNKVNKIEVLAAGSAEPIREIANVAASPAKAPEIT